MLKFLCKMALNGTHSWPSASEDSRIWMENTSLQSAVGHICRRETRGDGGPTVCLLKNSVHKRTHADSCHSRVDDSDTSSQRRLSSPSPKLYVAGGGAGPRVPGCCFGRVGGARANVGPRDDDRLPPCLRLDDQKHNRLSEHGP